MVGDTDNAHKLEQRIDDLDNKVDIKLDELTRLVLRIEGNMMPRAEVYGEDAKRVLVETYNAAHQALTDRITKLESGPQRFLAYFGAATGCLSVAVAVVGLIIVVLIAYFTKR